MLHLDQYAADGRIKLLMAAVVLMSVSWAFVPRKGTTLCIILYLVASPSAILENKYLLKDLGFGYPVTVSALGQIVTAIFAALMVHTRRVPVDRKIEVPWANFVTLGGASALALVLATCI